MATAEEKLATLKAKRAAFERAKTEYLNAVRAGSDFFTVDAANVVQWSAYKDLEACRNAIELEP